MCFWQTARECSIDGMKGTNSRKTMLPTSTRTFQKVNRLFSATQNPKKFLILFWKIENQNLTANHIRLNGLNVFCFSISQSWVNDKWIMSLNYFSKRHSKNLDVAKTMINLLRLIQKLIQNIQKFEIVFTHLPDLFRPIPHPFLSSTLIKYHFICLRMLFWWSSFSARISKSRFFPSQNSCSNPATSFHCFFCCENS